MTSQMAMIAQLHLSRDKALMSGQKEEFLFDVLNNILRHQLSFGDCSAPLIDCIRMLVPKMTSSDDETAAHR